MGLEQTSTGLVRLLQAMGGKKFLHFGRHFTVLQTYPY
jgi:hypothetical protein